MEELEMKAPYFESLKRNLGGGIDGVYFNGQFPEGVPYTLDPALGHIAKAEAGEWGDIAELDQATKTAHEQAEARAAIIAEIAILEAMITPRRDREARRTGDYSFIDGIDDEIAVLRGTLE